MGDRMIGLGLGRDHKGDELKQEIEMGFKRTERLPKQTQVVCINTTADRILYIYIYIYIYPMIVCIPYFSISGILQNTCIA